MKIAYWFWLHHIHRCSHLKYWKWHENDKWCIWSKWLNSFMISFESLKNEILKSVLGEREAFNGEMRFANSSPSVGRTRTQELSFYPQEAVQLTWCLGIVFGGSRDFECSVWNRGDCFFTSIRIRLPSLGCVVAQITTSDLSMRLQIEHRLNEQLDLFQRSIMVPFIPKNAILLIEGRLSNV